MMASLGEPVRRSPFQNTSSNFSAPTDRALPIHSAGTAHTQPDGEPMDVSDPQPSSLMPPPTTQALTGSNERAAEQTSPEQHGANGTNQPIGAAAAAQQPKVVQTAFIHKLYNMLEDQTIQHLISWSSTNESFVMSPSSEFSKVLAQYFKHTNISSFVRQLNMYGFHKVSDVFHTGSPDSPLWEFKHGAGSFRRGDLAGLREIKRRASRHTLIHRDSFSTAPPSKPPPLPPQPGVPVMEPVQDPIEARFNMLEWNMQDLYARLARTEDAYTAVRSKCLALVEGLSKCQQWSQQLSHQLLVLVPDPENQVHRDMYTMRDEISRQVEHFRSLDEPNDILFSSSKPFTFGAVNAHVEPMSPRQRPADHDSRRPSLQAGIGPSAHRTPIPQHLQSSPRWYGSIGSASGAHSPTSSRQIIPPPPPPPPPPRPAPPHQQPHPLSNMASSPSNLPRRHTSADIRLQGWQGGHPPGSSPYASGHSSTAWPSSPRAAPQTGDTQLQDALAQYELPKASNLHPRQASPPPHHEPGIPSFNSSFGAAAAPPPSYANPNDAGWQLPGPRYPFAKGLETPGPPTRRSSMASNVHSLLNPADTAEREGEDEGDDPRKRKRVL